MEEGQHLTLPDSPSAASHPSSSPPPDGLTGDYRIVLNPWNNSSSSPEEQNINRGPENLTSTSYENILNTGIKIPLLNKGAIEDKSTNIKEEPLSYEGEDHAPPLSAHIKEEPLWNEDEYLSDIHTTSISQYATNSVEETLSPEEHLPRMDLSSPGDQTPVITVHIKEEPYWDEEEEKYHSYSDASTPMNQLPDSYTNIKKESDASNEEPFSSSSEEETRYITDIGSYAEEKPYKAADYSNSTNDPREEVFICTECGLSFASISKLHDHHQATHPNKEYGKSVVAPPKKDYEKSVVIHPVKESGSVVVHPEKEYEKSVAVNLDEEHRKTRSNVSLLNDQTMQSSKEQFTCDECGQQFLDSAELAKHDCTHPGSKLYDCEECGKCFPYEPDLVSHRKIHTDVKPYSCSECGKSFVTKAVLTVHQRTHTGEKPYPCSECGKRFSQLASLSRHLKCHAGERTFACHECGRAFTHKAYLLSHEKTHWAEKPYPCPECGQGFSTSTYLKEHLRSHRGENPYCEVCRKYFTSSTSLAVHRRMHTGEKLFVCPICMKGFCTKANFESHQRVHTRETKEKRLTCRKCGECFDAKFKLVEHQKSHKLPPPSSSSPST